MLEFWSLDWGWPTLDYILFSPLGNFWQLLSLSSLPLITRLLHMLVSLCLECSSLPFWLGNIYRASRGRFPWHLELGKMSSPQLFMWHHVSLCVICHGSSSTFICVIVYLLKFHGNSLGPPWYPLYLAQMDTYVCIGQCHGLSVCPYRLFQDFNLEISLIHLFNKYMIKHLLCMRHCGCLKI